MGHRATPRLRRTGQLFRSRQSLRLARCLARRIRNLRRDVWVSVQRLQLDLRAITTSFRTIARPPRRPPRRHREHGHLERGLLRGYRFDGHRRLVCGAPSFGNRRGADISGVRESHGLLVPQKRTQPGNRRVRFGGKILVSHRGSDLESGAAAFRMALELCRHRPDQRSFSRAFLRFLSQSQ